MYKFTMKKIFNYNFITEEKDFCGSISSLGLNKMKRICYSVIITHIITVLNEFWKININVFNIRKRLSNHTKPTLSYVHDGVQPSVRIYSTHSSFELKKK